MPGQNPGAYNYEPERMTFADQTTGKDDGRILERQQVGEIAFAEIGADGNGSLSGFDIIALGGMPEPRRQNNVGKVEGDLQGDQDGDGTIEDVPPGTKIRFRLTDYSHTETIDKTKWFNAGDVEQTDAEKRPTSKFDGVDDAEWAKQGRHVVTEVKNVRGSVAVSVSDSYLEAPYIGARESVGN